MIVKHTLEPIFDKNSKTLILGSMPSIKSRELKKYYGNKTNRFWRVMEIIFNEKIVDYKEFILKYNLALWDVISSCDIKSSSDASIKDVKINDIKWLIDNSSVKNIVLLGNKAYQLYQKYLEKDLGIKGIYLPSPSSANARFSLEDLCDKYKIIKDLAG